MLVYLPKLCSLPVVSKQATNMLSCVSRGLDLQYFGIVLRLLCVDMLLLPIYLSNSSLSTRVSIVALFSLVVHFMCTFYLRGNIQISELQQTDLRDSQKGERCSDPQFRL